MDIAFSYQVSEPVVVMDVGGYQGEFTDWVRKTYGCGVHIFEPSAETFRFLIEKYKHDPLVWPYDVALEDEHKEGILHGEANCKTIYKNSESPMSETIKIRDVWKFIDNHKFEKVDILKLNCEGSEYKILPRLIETHKIEIVKNIVVQFHYFTETAGQEKEEILKKLDETHRIEYQDDHWMWLIRK